MELMYIKLNNINYDYTTPLMAACEIGNEAMIKYLVEHGVDVSYGFYNGEYEGETPLKAACRGGNISIVKYLFEQGTNINNMDDEEDIIPLIEACIYEHENIIKYLVAIGADPNKDK